MTDSPAFTKGIEAVLRLVSTPPACQQIAIASAQVRAGRGTERTMCFEGCWVPAIGLVALGYWWADEPPLLEDTSMFYAHEVSSKDAVAQSLARMRERALREYHERLTILLAIAQ